MNSLIETNPNGLYCKVGDFYVDPWRPVNRAVITHAHSDHARPGSRRYLAAETGQHVLRTRLGQNATLDFLPFGHQEMINGVKLTFVPAGHILGSAQVRLEYKGEVAVVSGDYKRNPDSTCQPFEPIRCHTFVTESTFGLPVYRWPNVHSTFKEINQWWQHNQTEGKATVLLAYALGKAQRLLSGLDPGTGPIFTHGAVEKLNQAYRASNVDLPKTHKVTDVDKAFDWSKALIIAPPSALGTSWAKRFGPFNVGMASGWMQIRGTRRRRNMDKGFILSDHVDWNDLLQTIAETEAEHVLVTHGYSAIVVRHLKEIGLKAHILETEFGNDEDADVSDAQEVGQALDE